MISSSKHTIYIALLILASPFLFSTSGPNTLIRRNDGGAVQDTIIFQSLLIPPRPSDAEGGKAFMQRIDSLPLSDREEAIYQALTTGNIPDFLRTLVTIRDTCSDANGVLHQVQYQVMPDYLSIGSADDFCRIPMNPHTAQRTASQFGASLITAKISDQIYRHAPQQLEPFYYAPVGRENESVAKFILHNNQIETQKAAAGGTNGILLAGIKKDVILSNRMDGHPDKVVIYGWHKSGGIPIQPVYSGHADWYVDYSHGIRLMNKMVLVDGSPFMVSELLQDSILFKLLSDEDHPMIHSGYDD